MSIAETSLPDTSAAATGPLRVVLWGTYDTSKPRTRILRDGLRAQGVQLTEIHANIWSGDADKSQLSRGQMLLRLLKMLVIYPLLIWRYLRAPAHDVVLVPYLGQFDVLVLRPFALLRGKPVMLDLFISLYDTVVQDRQMLGAGHPVAWLLWQVERLSCRAADLVLLDTKTHATRIAKLLRLDPACFDAVPVGAEPDAFAPVPARQAHDGPVRVLFYGQLIPLHGVETILKAALSDEGRAYDWHIVGTGQDQPKVATALDSSPAGHITWTPWLPYADLRQAIANADICLGIFGTSDKAASVVPNKVYQCLSAGRPVITRASAAMDELFETGSPGLAYVPAGNADALLAAIDKVAKADFPVMDAAHMTIASPAQIGQRLQVKLNTLTGKA